MATTRLSSVSRPIPDKQPGHATSKPMEFGSGIALSSGDQIYRSDAIATHSGTTISMTYGESPNSQRSIFPAFFLRFWRTHPRAEESSADDEMRDADNDMPFANALFKSRVQIEQHFTNTKSKSNRSLTIANDAPFKMALGMLDVIPTIEAAETGDAWAETFSLFKKHGIETSNQNGRILLSRLLAQAPHITSASVDREMESLIEMIRNAPNEYELYLRAGAEIRKMPSVDDQVRGFKDVAHCIARFLTWGQVDALTCLIKESQLMNDQRAIKDIENYIRFLTARLLPPYMKLKLNAVHQQ